MSDFIGIDISGIPELEKKLKLLPDAVQDAIVDEVSEYLLDVLKIYPPPKYVTRKAAYGKSFFTRRQQRWFFWALNNGYIRVPYHRTQGLRKAWRIIDSGRNSIIVNETQAALYTMDDEKQSRHEMLVGWKIISEILRERRNQIIRRAEAGARKAIKKLGL